MDRQKVEISANGFTLVELLVTVAVLLVLASMATMQFGKMTTKTSIEKQVRMMYSDLMELRTSALYEKVPRAVKVTPHQFLIYPGIDTSSAPVLTRALSHAVAWSGGGSSLVLRYDTYGISNDAVTLCVEPDNDNASSVDSLIVSKTRIRMGKRQETSCVSESVHLK